MIDLLLFTLLTQPVGIHQIDYYHHIDNAVFSSISQRPQEYIPLQIRINGMMKKYYGYCPYWIDTTCYQYFQMELLTHLAYFSVEIDPSTGELGDIPNQDRFFIIRDLAHNHGTAVHMTFIIFGSSNVTTFLNNDTARQNAIFSMSEFLTNYGIEGVNIDFEFVLGSVRDSFNLFIHNLYQAMIGHPGGRKELYIASIAVPEWYPGYDVAYLADNSDGLFIMAYDFHWSGASIAGPVSPCVPSSFWGQYCAAKSIGSYKECGVDTSKLILGVPYYGYDWPTESGDIGSNTTGNGVAVSYYSAFQNANTYGRLWDENSLTPWYRYYTTGWHQCWYDDSVSLDIKFGMVNDSMIAGAGCWALGYDRDYDHLWNTVRRNFWDSLYVAEKENSFCPNGIFFRTIFSRELEISLKNSFQPYRITVYDITGRRMSEEYTGGGLIRVGSGLKPGVYIIFINDGVVEYRYKIIKLRN